jgi:hypothetical protein
MMTKIFKAFGVEFAKPLTWRNWLILAWVGFSICLLSIDIETSPLWVVALIVANFCFSVKVATKRVPDIKDEENNN